MNFLGQHEHWISGRQFRDPRAVGNNVAWSYHEHPAKLHQQGNITIYYQRPIWRLLRKQEKKMKPRASCPICSSIVEPKEYNLNSSQWICRNIACHLLSPPSCTYRPKLLREYGLCLVHWSIPCYYGAWTIVLFWKHLISFHRIFPFNHSRFCQINWRLTQEMSNWLVYPLV